MAYSYKTDTSTIVSAKGKGGVASSMTVAMLAFEFAARGANVLAIDADLVTQTLTRWMADAQAEDTDSDMPFSIYTYEPDAGTLVEAAVRLARRDKYDIVMYDMAADSRRVLQVAKFADLFIGPTGAKLDQYAPGVELHAAVMANVPDANWLSVLTSVPREGQGIAATAREALVSEGVNVAATEIRNNATWYSDWSGKVPTSRHQYADLADEINPFLKKEWKAKP